MEDLFQSLLASEAKDQILAVIAKNAEVAYKYAWHTGKRFEIGEAEILKHPKWAAKYAIGIIKGRWPEAEDVIAESPVASWNYFIKIPDFDVSPKIYRAIEKHLVKSDPDKILEFADIIGGKLPEILHNRMILEGNKEYLEHLEASEKAAIGYFRSLNSEEQKSFIEKANA